MSWTFIFIGLIILIGVAVAVILLLNGSKSDEEKASKKALYKSCKSSFDCETGFFCELRDHPSDGICVIPPGGACHKVSGIKSDACYSGYYCDIQDGICLKIEN